MNLRNIALFSLLALLIVAFALPASAAPRQCVILEGFTQWNCGPCAGWNPTEATVMNGMTRDTVIAVKYHGWWPGANNDPFYLWNQSDNTARINLYGVNGVPDMRLDGYLSPPRNASGLRTQIRNEYGMDCPCTIEISALAQGETGVYCAGSVSAEDDITGLRLFVALITNAHYAPPQGSNGETAWYDVFRDHATHPTTGHVLFSEAGQTETFEFSLQRDPSWDVENMTVVAWVQDMGSLQIVQGVNTSVTQDYGFLTTTTEVGQQMIEPADEEITYAINLLNIGNLSDTYNAELLGDFPDGWSYTIEAAGVAPHASEIDVPLNSLEDTDLIVRLNSNGNPGFVDFSVYVTSPNEPLLTSTDRFRIMGGLDILVVDDDEGDSFEYYFMEALAPYSESTNMVHGVWDAEADALDNSYWSDIDVIVWLTGNSFQDGNTLTPLDQLVLGDYLTAGGRLFLSGQGIGFDIRTDQFMSDHLHCSYLRNWPQGQALTAVTGDPISDGMDVALTGGTGASNQTRQSALSALDGMAVPIFSYEGTDYDAAMRIEAPAWPSGTFRAIYLGFGLEAIADAQIRTDLMANGLDWLTGPEAAPEDDPTATLPNTFELGQNFPNPFNPETTIPFSLADRSVVTLSVYDVLGRQVTELTSGIFEAGAHSVNWNPTELSSGIYFYTIEAVAGDNTFRSTRKLVLMK